MTRPLSPTIHARGEGGRLDAVLELVAYSARPRPLTTSLDELPRRIAQVFGADVCSIYLLEGDDLVMRGNVGFRKGALGEVRLPVGQGITGLAVEYMRPMSLDAAHTHASFKHFPGLGEERFPIFLAVPVAGPAGPLGALVLQRREPPAFERADIELAVALTAPIAAIADRARLVDALKDRKRGTTPGSRRVTLPGRPVFPGRAIGPFSMLPRPSSRALGATPVLPRDEARRALDKAVTQAQRSLDALAKRAKAPAEAESQLLSGLKMILDDSRLTERAIERVEMNESLPQALTHVGAEALRVASRANETFGKERAAAIAEVCEALSALSAPERPIEVPRSAVLAADQLSIFDLLVSLRSQPSAVVLSEPPSPICRSALMLIGVPSIAEVAGLFRLAAEGEIALVDGDHGLLRLNPSRAEISMVRTEKKHPAKSPVP